jgi:signal transduction histidine kinase
MGSGGITAIAILAAVLGALAGYRLARRGAKARRREERAREQALLDRVAAGLAHEIKNPLGALSLNVQLLEEELAASGQLSSASRARLAAISKDYHRLEDVVNNFLRYAANRRMSLSDVDVNDLVHELVTFVKPDLVRADATLDLALSEAPVMCRVDAPLLKQALLNVMLNALEAMPTGKGTLGVSTEQADGTVRISLKDTGIGIAESDLPRIFDAYFSRKAHGTGLGLAITRRIIEDHDGRIDVESAPGSGTTVTISLPAAGPAAKQNA